MRQLYTNVLAIVFSFPIISNKKYMKQKNMILLNYAIDTIIKLCYYITINREQQPGRKAGRTEEKNNV